MSVKKPWPKRSRAKRSLGQNFLKNKSIVKEIVGAANIKSDDVVLEIGPGKGILTAELLKKAREVIAVEKDNSLYEFLKEKFSKEIRTCKLNLVLGDILHLDTQHPSGLLSVRKYKLVANIPYNITGEIIRKFLTSSFQPELIVLLVQKEVAERLSAKNSKESILSISVRAYGKPRYIKKVSASNFSPQPRVDSAILLIDNISKEFFKNIDEKKFFELVKAGFSQKRKKLLNTLKILLGKEVGEVLIKTGIEPNLRAEKLTLLDWKKLFLQNEALP